MTTISRKEFLAQVGIGAAVVLLPSCLVSCKKNTTNTTPSANSLSIDFTLSVASGALSTNGGYLVHNGVIVARTNSGTYIAVAASCTHEGTNVQYSGSTNSFTCPNHGAKFDASGNVTNGPANTALQRFNTTLSGTSLRVYS